MPNPAPLIERAAQLLDSIHGTTCDHCDESVGHVCEICHTYELVALLRAQVVRDFQLRQSLKRDTGQFSKNYANIGERYDERADELGAAWCNGKSEAFALIEARLRKEDGDCDADPNQTGQPETENQTCAEVLGDQATEPSDRQDSEDDADQELPQIPQ